MRVLPVLTALSGVAVAAVVTASPSPAAASSPVASYIVTTAGAPDALLGAVERLGGDVGFVYRNALTGFSVSLPTALVGQLRALPGVSGIEADGVMRASSTQAPVPSYGLDRIDQRALPLSNSYTYGATGAGVAAYIVDTGILFSHADFGGRAVSGFDAVDGGSADDCNGHGTHVSGTVGGATYGVAKGVRLVGVRVLDCGGSGATSGVIAGVDWVTGDHDPGEPAVANMSLGGGASTTLDAAVEARDR